MSAALADSTKVIRTAWRGPPPEVGDMLSAPDARVFYKVRQITDEGATLALLVSRHGKPTTAPGCTVHPFPQPSAATPAPAPAVAPPAPCLPPAHHPTPKADAASLRAASDAKRRRIHALSEPPAHSDGASWPDPDDQVQTRTPPQVRGFKRGAILEKMQRRGSDISREQIVGAAAFALDWDISTIGLTGRSPLEEGANRVAAGPVSGPSLAATEQARRGREVVRLLRQVGPDPAPALLVHVVVLNRGVAAWCDEHPRPDGRPPCAKQIMGRLLGVLDICARFYGALDRPEAAR